MSWKFISIPEVPAELPFTKTSLNVGFVEGPVAPVGPLYADCIYVTIIDGDSGLLFGAIPPAGKLVRLVNELVIHFNQNSI